MIFRTIILLVFLYLASTGYAETFAEEVADRIIDSRSTEDVRLYCRVLYIEGEEALPYFSKILKKISSTNWRASPLNMVKVSSCVSYIGLYAKKGYYQLEDIPVLVDVYETHIIIEGRQKTEAVLMRIAELYLADTRDSQEAHPLEIEGFLAWYMTKKHRVPYSNFQEIGYYLMKDKSKIMVAFWDGNSATTTTAINTTIFAEGDETVVTFSLHDAILEEQNQNSVHKSISRVENGGFAVDIPIEWQRDQSIRLMYEDDNGLHEVSVLGILQDELKPYVPSVVIDPFEGK